MNIHYTRKDFKNMPKIEKVGIIKTGLFTMPDKSFWDKLREYKSKCLRKTA